MADTEIPRSFQEVLLPHLPYAEASELSAADDLAALGLDSMGVVQLLAELEDAFGVELPDEALTEETFETVGSLWSAVDAHTAAGASAAPEPAGHE
ncbi:phosphopantetheine-binding protein [Actinacidiphila sp. DG2A-62]|uniref:phosphopantetheine-binding protein n=1 Tax=Actinacidiphila sp. DG2A-62 TaxID=3108821 RepID=UPI002DB76D99|nr:phosphopantetheine-binding protein [Actinacidiphila sp. DG2A-62]MEC3998163.1 phosphopantetheine-binding protein [Actinacidiphila sp. DG2A-62]